MNKRGRLNIPWFLVVLIILFLAVFIIANLGFFEELLRQKAKKPNPIMEEKISLKEGESLRNPDFNLSEKKEYRDFKEKCLGAGGGSIFYQKAGEIYLECYKPASDAGKSCSSDAECDSANCDFQEAISSGVCVLFKTDKDLAGGTYTYTYQCNSENPAVCSSLPRGEDIEFYMQGTLLIETGYREFPGEEEEFGPD